MPDFHSDHLGEGVREIIPEFNHGTAVNSWQEIDVALKDVSGQRQTMRCKRALCYNLPARCFARDGARFRNWCTPARNVSRAAQLAAALGMIFTPTSKGYFSGVHNEFQRANGEADEDAEGEDGGSGDGGKTKKAKRCYRYAFMPSEDNNITAPMFVIGYEELYNTAKTEVVAIRVWKFIFHGEHSDTELHRKLMDENMATCASGGVAHTQVNQRNKCMVTEMKHNRDLAMQTNLEYFAGTQYLRVTTETVFLDVIKQASGISQNSTGRPPIDFAHVPAGMLNQRLAPSKDEMGGVCVLSPEYMYNGKREMALCANLIDLETGEPIDVLPDYLTPSAYWSHAGDLLTHATNREKEGFFVNIDPTCNNIFDCSLPRAIYGNVCAGDTLLTMFKEQLVAKQPELANCHGPRLAEQFTAYITDEDQLVRQMCEQMGENIICYDSLDLTEAHRKAMQHKKYAHYGQKDEGAYIIEPVQGDKDLQKRTQKVYTGVVQAWLASQQDHHTALEVTLRVGADADADMIDCPISDERMQPLRDAMAATQQRHYDVMKDLFELHANSFAAMFQSNTGRSDMPMGYCAMWDGLQKELDSNTNGTASVAFEYGNELVADDISQFAHIHMWLGEFFEKDVSASPTPAPWPRRC